MRMWPKRLTFNTKIAWWPTHQGKIDIVIAKRFNGLCSIPDDKVEIDSCMLAQKCRNEMSREVLGCRYRAESNTAAVPTQLPAGWQIDKVFGAPATGTADDFLEVLGVALLLGGLVLLQISRRAGARS